MQDTELYKHLLGIKEPWTVGRVALDVKKRRVDVWAEHQEDANWRCPECKDGSLPLYDHAPERTWRHLDSCHFETYLHARPPRVDCSLHGPRQVVLPWAESNSRFTLLFERLAIDVLRETSVKGGAEVLGITWDEAWGIMKRAVARGLLAKCKRNVSHIGIDEKAVAKGHTYFTLVSDLKTGTVEYVADGGRKTEDLDGFFKQLSPSRRASIVAVAMDMWEPYVNSVISHVPGAVDKIVFDRFHIMQHAGVGVDKVRKQEHKALLSDGDDTLKGSKYLWLYSQENLPEKHVDRFEALRRIDLKTSRAWALKEALRHLWSYYRRGWAERHWKRWYFWATHSRLKPIIVVANMIKRHLHNVLTYFAHRITNATSEGLNSKIQTIKQRACGFRNRDNFKTAIYFHCGGLKLYPNAR